MLIDQSYFINKLALPQLGNTDGLAEINSFIEQYEQVYLKCVLGTKLWKAFDEGTDGSGLPTEQRWIDLIDGDEVEYDNKLIIWNGFAPSTKISPIANFIFHEYVDYRITDFTLTGTVQSTTDNNRNIDPTDKLVDAWNRMVDMNFQLFRYLKANRNTYPEWHLCRCRYNDCRCHEHCYLFEKKNYLGI